jgi:hypothetical protein
MTPLEQIEHRLDFLLSQYTERKNDPGYRLQIAILAAERRALLKQSPRADVE